MKKLSVLILLTMLLGACTDKPVAEPEVKSVTTKEDTAKETKVNELTQDEMNENLKEDAVEIVMSEALDEEIEERTLVKSTGEIMTIYDGIRGGDFTLTTEVGGYHGIYSIMNLTTREIELSIGQTVTVYGSYNGLDEEGFPEIVATLIE